MKEVKDFYKDIPFNYSKDVEFYSDNIKNSNQVLEYIDLHKLLSKTKIFSSKGSINDIIEFGCGTGWLTNTIAFYYGKQITSVDFTDKAIKMATSVSQKLKLFPDFHVSDIFDFKIEKMYDLVISLGVLHHTSNCHKAFKKISTFVKKGGYLYVGLYHLYGRRPMLQFLQSQARWHGEDSAYNLFKKMNSLMDDDSHSYSWFRDQVIHPHETQHTYKELVQWMDEIGFKVVSTSINNYKNLKNFKNNDLFEIEKGLEKYSYNKNINDLKFNPGYFTVCAKKV